MTGTGRAAGRRPRLLYVGNTTYDLPLSTELARKWDSVADRVELRLIARAGDAQADPVRSKSIVQRGEMFGCGNDDHTVTRL